MGGRRQAPGVGRVRIRKRSGGNYYARFQDNSGKRPEVNLKVTNKIAAERKAAKINEALERDQPWHWVLGRTQPGERTFSDLVDEFLDHGCRWSDSTRTGNTGTVGQLRKEFGTTPVTHLDRSHIEGYLARRADAGLSKSSRNRYLTTLRVILEKGVEWGYLPHNPATGIKQESEGRKLPRPYRDTEVAGLLAALDPETRDIATVYLHTALRRGELMKLLWGDVDLPGASLIVRHPKNLRDRVVPLSDDAKRILTNRRRQWLTEQTDGQTDLRVYGPRANIAKAVVRVWHVVPPERRLELRPVHSFRDTAITRLAASHEVALPVVQELAGHQNIEMTRRYAEVSPEAARDAIKAVFTAR